MARKLICLWAVAAVCMIGTSAVGQQGRSELRGRVTDDTGGALPGVSVVVTNQNTGTFRELITSGDGSFFAAQLIPGVFTITAELPGFRGFQRIDFAIGVGNTLDIDIVLEIGALEETITVSGEAPLVDLTSAEVGGTVTAQELIELPTLNRSAFAAVALLPGIQFQPSSSLGNDTMIANGQTSGGNTMGVDGATNNDDISGSGAGGQVRVPLESVQEFQVLSNQFDAEFGRVRGAIINAVTKQGTNQFSGALFDYYTSDAMTTEDYFVARSDSVTKPKTNKTEFGGVIGGPIVRDKAHFFVSVERQLVNPSRSRIYDTRPDLNFSLSENWKGFNTLFRVDHQMNANNTWAFRTIREVAPQFNLVGNRSATLNTIQDETDDDQIYVGTYTSVFGNNKVNTVRIVRTYESAYRGNPCWRANGGFDNVGNQVTCPPQWSHPSFQDNQLNGSGGRDDFNWQYANTFSWFVPDMGGDHDFKFGGTFHRSVLQEFNEGNLNGTFTFDTDRVFDSARPLHLPRTAQRPGRQPPREALPVPGVHHRGVLPGQVAGERSDDHRARHPLRPGDFPGRPPGRAGWNPRQPDDPQRAGPHRQEQLVAAHLHRLRRHRRRPVGAAGGVRDLLRQDPDRHSRQLHAESEVHRLVHQELPVEQLRPGTGERNAPDRPVPVELRPRW